MRAFTCLLPSQWLIGVVGFWAIAGLAIPVGAQVPMSDGTIATEGAIAEASYTSSGTYFSRELGTPLRFGYHSEGYGTDRGVASLGAMKVFNLDGAAWFLDGQGTMSDDFGGGYNAGLGYRELVNLDRGFDAERILGASFWSDGQNTDGDNFFNQLSFGLESLGESYDLRLNGYFPLERTKESDAEQISFDEIIFQNHELFAGREIITTSTAYSVIDAEFAKRIGNLDAWGIAGVYHLGGGDADDTGYRLGVRGYAVPDLAVTLQVTDDDIYHTNVMIGLTWFVGRTHTGNAPVGSIVDRFREPVWRNDFIATTASTREQGAGEALTDAENDEKFYFIHINSDAAAGGDGSIENPFNNLAEAEAAQQTPFDEGRPPYVYVHGGSTLAATDTFTLLDNVKFWGEGINQDGDVVLHTVDTVERGTVFLPETSPGAQDLDSPTINIAAGVNFLELADNNNVNNFRMNGGATTISGNAVNAPQLANLDINDPTNIGISLIDITGTTVIDNTVTIDGADTISMFIQGGEDGMNINAIINNDSGRALEIRDRTGGTIAYGGTITSTGGTGILIEDNVDANITFTDEITLATGANDALQILNNSADTGATIRFNELLEIDTTDGDGVVINGNDDDMTYQFANIDITTQAGAGFTATGDGTLIVTSAEGTNSIATTTGRVLNLSGMSIGTGGANFDTVDATGVAISADNPDANAITLQNLDGTGQLRIGSGEDPGDGGTLVSNGNDDDPAFFVNNVDNLVVNNVTIDNSAAPATGAGLVVTGQDGGTATFNGLNSQTIGNASAVNVNGNEAGTITFNNLVAESVNGTAVVVDNNEGATINFNEDLTVTATGTGQGFIASNGGTVSVAAAGDTQVNTNSGTAIEINDVTIAGTNATFDEVNVTAGTDRGIWIQDVTGTGQIVAGSGTTAGDGGTITMVNAGTGVEIDNADNVAINNIIINKSGTGQAALVIGQDGGSALFNGVEINSTGAANGLVVGTATAGEENTEGTFTANNLDVTTVDGNAVSVIENEGGEYIFTNLEATTTGAGDGVVINNNSADTTVTFNNMAIEATATGDGFVASNGGTVIATGTNTVSTETGTAVNLNGVVSGGITFTDVDVDGAANGVIVSGVTGSAVNIGSTATASSLNTTGDAIQVTNSTLVNITNVDVTGNGGNGLVANHTNGVAYTLNVTDLTVAATKAGGIVSTHTGAGAFNLSVEDSDIDAASSFSHTGAGTYTLGISDSAFAETVAITGNGSGNMDLTIDDNSFVTSAIGDIALSIDLDPAVTLANIRVRRNNITSDNAAAFNLDSSSASTKTVNFLFDTNVVSNNSATAAARYIANQATILNATVTNNTFNNAGGVEYEMTANSASVINLNLNANIAQGGSGNFILTEAAGGTFNVQDRDTAQTRNTGTITFNPDIADFGNIGSVPTPP